MDFRADLHCHTTASDGSFSPKEVIDLALKEGLKGLSITDHDTIKGSLEVTNYAKEQGIKLIMGMEVSVEFDNQNVHILIYSFDYQHKAIQELVKEQESYRTRRNRGILNLLEKEGISISEEELFTHSKTFSVGRPHIAKVLKDRGITQTIQEGFDRYFGQGRPCYHHEPRISCEDVVDIARQANGFSVIAHPHLLPSKKLADSLMTLPFDGIEAYYAKMPPYKEQYWVELANKHKLMITGGSDFHGAIKPRINLGSSWINEETFQKLWERHQCNNP